MNLTPTHVLYRVNMGILTKITCLYITIVHVYAYKMHFYNLVKNIEA